MSGAEVQQSDTGSAGEEAELLASYRRCSGTGSGEAGLTSSVWARPVRVRKPGLKMVLLARQSYVT